MASTAGGFLLGFGLCVLLVCLGAGFLLEQYYGQVMSWKGTVERVYEITHSSGYRRAMDALSALSPYASRIADALRNPLLSLIGLGWLANYASYVEGVSQAYSYMKQAYDASEAAYRAIGVVEVAPQYLIYGMGFGLLLMIIGAVLIVRSRRR
jgi:hypothetical protein